MATSQQQQQQLSLNKYDGTIKLYCLPPPTLDKGVVVVVVGRGLVDKQLVTPDETPLSLLGYPPNMDTIITTIAATTGGE